jgi:alpha-L-fucosidase
MKPTEVNNSIIGKRCKCIFTGMMVTGVIEDITKDQHAAHVKVRFDEPHVWGNEHFEYNWSFARLTNGFGSLRYLEIIDDKYQTIRVTFSKTIREIDRDFVKDYTKWQRVNLKEWVDNYESSRFTQISECSAIITSDDTVHLIEWLKKNIQVKSIEELI